MSESLITCPHCGRTLWATQFGKHNGRCPCDPTLYDAIRAGLDAGGGYAVRSTAYAAQAAAHRLPSRAWLVATHGSWQAAVEYYGLAMTEEALSQSASRSGRTRGQSRRAAQLDAEIGAEVDALTEEAQRAIEAARYPSGLAVCRVRELPDGRVACVLR